MSSEDILRSYSEHKNFVDYRRHHYQPVYYQYIILWYESETNDSEQSMPWELSQQFSLFLNATYHPNAVLQDYSITGQDLTLVCGKSLFDEL